MNVEELFNKELLKMKVEELIKIIDETIEENLPEGKSLEDFTGGYIQQLENYSTFVAYFGTKPGSKNRSSSQIRIDNEDIDLMYLMLKAKLNDMRNKKRKVKSVSLSAKLASAKADGVPKKIDDWN